MLSAGKPLQWVASQLGHSGVAKIDETYVAGGTRTSFRRAHWISKSSSDPSGICRRLLLERRQSCQEFAKKISLKTADG